MSFANARARLSEAKYRHLGFAALWNGTAVHVRLDQGEKLGGQGFDKALMMSNTVEISVLTLTPHQGDAVVVLDDAGNAIQTFTVIAEPKIINNGTDWSCEVDV